MFKKKKLTDVEIVEGFAARDPHVQQEWFRRCSDCYGNIAPRFRGLSDYDRQEHFQESFILVWQKMESGQIYVDGDCVMDSRRSGTVVLQDLTAYFVKVADNKYLEFLRRNARTVTISENVAPAEAEVVADLYWDEDPEVEADRVVTSALMSLPKSCQEILTLYYYERKSLREIFETRAENTSYDGLKNQKSKCMKNLKQRISMLMSKLDL